MLVCCTKYDRSESCFQSPQFVFDICPIKGARGRRRPILCKNLTGHCSFGLPRPNGWIFSQSEKNCPGQMNLGSEDQNRIQIAYHFRLLHMDSDFEDKNGKKDTCWIIGLYVTLIDCMLGYVVGLWTCLACGFVDLTHCLSVRLIMWTGVCRRPS